ncbi:chymotrypsin-1 [Leptinotarsa decemlineata]|uniref:chymotrypsin-1 n=1 Tax=Leptinotarsa decemlineata TaxID=7539 RepID=UPI003D30D7A0
MRKTLSNVFFALIFFSECFLPSSTFISPRIFDGRSALREEVPYIVSIEIGDQQICSGSILDSQWIVTAAHCVANKTDLKVYAGLIHLNRKNDGDVQVADVEEVIIHPDYDYSLDTIENDVALLFLATHLTFNDVVQPIEIISETELSDAINHRRVGIISGWGHSENYYRSKILRTAEVILLSDEECLDDIKPDCHEFKPEAQLCSGPLTKQEKGVGLYDDGGPLVVNHKLAGIILHGEHEHSQERCHLSSIYARISNYTDFLRAYLTFPEPTVEPVQSTALEPCLLEVEVTFQLLNKFQYPVCSSAMGHSYVFYYNMWFFGSRGEEITNDCNLSPGGFPERSTEEVPETTSEIYANDTNGDEYDSIYSRNLKHENETSVNFEKLIFNIQFFTTHEDSPDGIGFRLLPNSPFDYYISFSSKIE